MTNQQVFRLDQISVLDVTGEDRDAIVHNLTTNEIKSLAVDRGCETFITDVRGKTLAHVMLYRLEDRLRMIGSAGVESGTSERVAEHADRYTIREDVTVSVRDDEFVAFVLPAAIAKSIMGDSLPTDAAATNAAATGTGRASMSIGSANVDLYSLPWLGPGTIVVLTKINDAEPVAKSIQTQLASVGGSIGDTDGFHAARIAVGFPWFGADLDDGNLPQEADRDEQTISFTKGCYLGQETVARLDALGQVQKKLVRWIIRDAPKTTIEPGAKLESDGKTVGRLTSVAVADDGTTIAIGLARRSHFDVGSEAKGTDEVTGDVYTAIVSDCE